MNSGYNNLCHMLIFVKSKKAFELFELFKILTHTLTSLKVKDLNFLMSRP